MDSLDMKLAQATNRRRFLAEAAIGSGALIAAPALAQSMVDLHLPGGPSERPITSAFPGKGSMILQRIHPPLLETPMSVFNGDVFTPNDQFFVRWHWADIPTAIDVEAFRIKVHGAVTRPLSISLAQLLKLPRVELAAINQCSGNSRALFQPPVAGAQWRHGAMGNAKWLGVRLRDVLDIADNLQRALDAVPEEAKANADPGLKALIEGVELTERSLLNTLEKNGVKKFDPAGEKFDPNFQQAMYEVPDPSVPAGTVIQVVQAGYTIGERVLRPALVAVSKGGAKAAPSADVAN